MGFRSFGPGNPGSALLVMYVFTSTMRDASLYDTSNAHCCQADHRFIYMTVFLILLIGGFAIAAAIALIRGLRAFMHDGDVMHRTGTLQTEAFGVKQNRMMSQRVLFQGIAILLIVLAGALASSN
jgi:Hypoxia induced protein conserved region